MPAASRDDDREPGTDHTDTTDAGGGSDPDPETTADQDSESAADAERGDTDPAAVVDGIDRPVVLFDGVCNLCNAFVRFIVRFDAEGEFLFAPLESPVGRELLDRRGVDDPESVVLVTADGYATKSTAALRIARRLDGPWPLAYPLVYLPERLRDAVYDLVAARRYRLFGRTDACPVPEPEIRERFLERSLTEA